MPRRLPVKPTSRRTTFSLRHALLAAFLVLGLLPALALSWLSFARTRDAMTGAITLSLAVQARTVQSDIDALMAERFENAAAWSRSELMRDLRLGDVDKRVSNYLRGLAQDYTGVYRVLDCVDETGRVIASSDAARIGTRRALPATALRAAQPPVGDGRTALSLADGRRLDEHAPLVLVTDIPADLSPVHMRLVLDFDAASLEHLLDTAAAGDRAVLVIDRQGRWVAASGQLRRLALPDEATRLAGARVAQGSEDAISGGLPWITGPTLVGRGHARTDARPATPGWTTLVFEPEARALAPVAQMAAIFAGLLLAVLLATVVSAIWIARTIAHPIAALTDSTRRYQREGRAAAAGPVGSRVEEVDVLERAFHEMMKSVEDSRKELVRSSRMAMLGELAAVLAHEVRTPLGILRSSAQILERNPALSAEERELTGFIESETERLNRLVSTMLDIARPPRLIVASCDLHRLLERCAQMHDLKRGRDGERFPVVLRLRATRAEVDGDPEQLMQVVFNLLNNASEAAGPRGRVELLTVDDDGFIAIGCADDGHGIPGELAERLFEPFVSGRQGGVGLGLAVARQIVVAHGGEIAALGRGELGGATFTVRLRRRQPHDIPETTT